MATSLQYPQPPSLAVVRTVSNGFLRNNARYHYNTTDALGYFYETFSKIDTPKISGNERTNLKNDLLMFSQFIQNTKAKAHESFSKELHVNLESYSLYTSVLSEVKANLPNLDKAIDVFENTNREQFDDFTLLIDTIIDDLKQLKSWFVYFKEKLELLLNEHTPPKDGVYFKIKTQSELDALRNKSYEYFV